MNFYKSLTCSAIAAMLAIFGTEATAQTVEISPKPQSIEWSNTKAFDNTATYTLVGAEEADADAVALFNKNFDTQNGKIKVYIGERGDKAVSSVKSLIPEKSEGYYLKIDGDKVFIAGNDGNGTYYGVQSFIQAVSQPQVMNVTISDYPSISDRGLVEGYYGNPYSESDRMDLFEFFGRQKMNVYIYGPKDDVYHKGKWREPYPTALGNKIAEYAAAAKANKVDFIWAIHPGVDIQWTKTDSVNIVNKLKKMYDLGIRTFAVFFDDIWGEGTKADKQAGLMNYINDELNKAYDDVNPLIICPTQYNKGWTSGDYLNVLGTQMDKSVRIMWTGNSVVDMIEMNDMTWINNQISRKAYIWLNYPVTDYCINHLLMGPTYGNGLDIANMLGGFTSNPMEYAMASKVSLYSIGDYCWNMENYDADASWESAITYLMPKNREAFHFFCENNVDLGSTVHGLRRYNESPAFLEVKDLFNNKIAAGDTTAAAAAMKEHFNKFTNVATTLMETDEAPELISEIMPWLKSMKYTGDRGVCLMEMYEALGTQNPEVFVDTYLRYQQLTGEQDALRSRDFEGTLKWAKPEVATLHVQPFLKSTLASLVTLYKSLYDYRIDVFPAQEIENGTYFIKYKNAYLTNKTPNVAGSTPAFATARDDTRPQRQEWHISLDPETGRYKIVNAEDSRYLNENGKFSAGSSNPYEAAWHTYYIMRLANGKYCIQNAGSAGNKFWTVQNGSIKQGSNTLEPSQFIFDIEPISGAEETQVIESGETYYIMNGELYLTNNNVKGSGGTPTFKKVATPAAAQEWVIEQDKNGKNNYKITSKADGRYLNEYAKFGTNAYYPDWNTYLILMMDGKFSIQTTQSAGEHFWNITDDHIEWDNNMTRSSSYVIEIIKKGTTSGITPVGSKKKIIIKDNCAILYEPAQNITIYDTTGRKATEAKESNHISLGTLQAGSYILVARTKGGNIITAKILR